MDELTTNPPAVNTFDFAGTFDKPVQVSTAFAGTGSALPTFAYNAVDPNLRDTYVQRWNFTVQKKLPLNMYMDVGYVGSKGTNLTMAFDGNRPLQIVAPGPNVASITARRPYQGFSTITDTKSIGNSTYHSLQAKVERR